MQVTPNILDELKKRGLFHQATAVGALNRALNKGSVTLYMGIDPTADDLHVGHFSALMVLGLFQKFGHRVIVIVGGGTGMVGDPSGKNDQRKFLSDDTIQENMRGIRTRMEEVGLLKFSGANKATMINNADWLGDFSFLKDFMRGIAPYFSVNQLVKLETFDSRLRNEQPLSLMEFLYIVLQSWDFLYLFDEEGCTLQVGGQDQWANMLGGLDLIKNLGKKRDSAHVLTFPLLTTSDGKKMGKSEKGTVWLNPAKTSPFDFYQYFVKQPDDMVETLLMRLTFLSTEKINQIMKESAKISQERMAYEITKLVHGQEEADKARNASKALYGGKSQTSGQIPVYSLRKGDNVTDVLVNSGSLKSRAEVKRRVQQNGVSIDDKKVTDPFLEITGPCIIKFGKSNFLKVVS